MEIAVIKIGSNAITGPDGLDEARINAIARDVSGIGQIGSMGYRAVVVSSGAVAAGKARLGLTGRLHDIKLKQAAAAVGQSTLMRAYERAFEPLGKKVAQVLLTRDVFGDKQRYINARNTLMTLLSLDVIPIINENDTVSIDEIKFGDNDHLAAIVASILGARRLIILSDVDGLYTCDPRKNKKAALISVVDEITPEMERNAGGAGSDAGTGGMYSKLMAARLATRHCVTVNIINGARPGLIGDVLADDAGADNGISGVSGSVGTIFNPARIRAGGGRKCWIAVGAHPRGTLEIDEGAAGAVVKSGKSLLPSGIKAVQGDFERGDAVYCVDSSGARLAKGLVNYASHEILKIMGKKTSQIEKTLGYKYSDEIIHRDNMTVF
jgi:glutamate 5-kinase